MGLFVPGEVVVVVVNVVTFDDSTVDELLVDSVNSVTSSTSPLFLLEESSRVGYTEDSPPPTDDARVGLILCGGTFGVVNRASSASSSSKLSPSVGNFMTGRLLTGGGRRWVEGGGLFEFEAGVVLGWGCSNPKGL